MATVRKKLVDADLIRHLGQVLHAAFLYAGFVSYGVQPPSEHVLRQTTTESGGTSLTWCRWYTAPQLAHREDAEAAVLVLCAAEGSSDVALVMFLTKARGMEGIYLERLDADTLTLSAGRRCSNQISWSLADGVCRGLLDQLRRRNGLTLPGFRSLPDDAKVEILKRLRSGVDLARVECTCRDLRRLVVARDGELWRHMYWHEAPGVNGRWRTAGPIIRYEDLYEDTISNLEFELRIRECSILLEFFAIIAPEGERVKSSENGVPRWKQKYLREYVRYVLLPTKTRVNNLKIIWRLRERPRPGDDVEGTGKASSVQKQEKVPRSAYQEKRRGCRGAGTTHSPSSPYRWSHR